MSKTKTVLAVLGSLFFLFVVRDFLINKNLIPTIFIEKNVAILRFEKEAFVFGEDNSDEAKMTIRAALPYFFSKTFRLDSVREGEESIGKEISIARVSKNIIKAVFQDQTILFIDQEISVSEKEKIVQMPISLEADLWVLRTNFYPDFLSAPKLMIASLVERSSKKITEFAKIQNLPLIAFAETKGARLEFRNGKWDLRTRE
jgi:hypothetical protein